jgi:1,4-alpha-glucan branching enzyme
VTPAQPVGTCCVILHTHLPWLAHHGAWPVGEEWLHQAWSSSYLHVVDLLHRLADEGKRDVLTIGVTPVLAAQLDDPYLLREFHTWLGFWQARAEGLAQRPEPQLRELATYEFRTAQRALQLFEDRWLHGASPVLRGLVDDGIVELLGGPATHPFQPLLEERIARFSLRTGLDDAQLRLGQRPAGIWAPECGHRPGLEQMYASLGVQRFVVDGPSMERAGRSTGAAWRVGDTDVVAFGRDLDVTYRVWSPSTSYPAGADYRDFHAFDHKSGFRPYRVTALDVDAADKLPWDPLAARRLVERDAADFVSVVRSRLETLRRERDGRPGLVVVAYDTELFGHWWHEGPQFLEQVLRLLPAAGIRVTTLRGAVEAGHVEGCVDLPAGSWGSGKDWHVWEGEQVADLAEMGQRVQRRLLDVIDNVRRRAPSDSGASRLRRVDIDQMAREALLALSSDWAFMVSKDTAATYARDRAGMHELRFRKLADGLVADLDVTAEAARQRAEDGPFEHLDARLL